MPLPIRIVEPIILGRKAEDVEESGDCVAAQIAVTQHTVLGALAQLATLVRHADDLFCDLTDECQKIFDRTELITHKINICTDIIRQLDSKKVKIPVGDLKQFTGVEAHHVAKHGYDSHTFTQDERPHCVNNLYSIADVTPSRILRGADAFRKDGLYTSNLFKLWPIVINEPRVKTPDLSFCRRGKKILILRNGFRKPRQPSLDRPRTFHELETDSNKKTEEEEEKNNLSKSQPSIFVAIDTSGSGFQRMRSFRQSLHGTSSEEYKKRRRTVSGVPDNILHEIAQFERKRRNTTHVGNRNQPRTYSFDDLDADDGINRDEILAQFFDEIDAKFEERLEEEQMAKEPKILKFLPCRRSRSLPRCVKSYKLSTPSATPEQYCPNVTLGCSYASSISLTSSTGSRLSRSSSKRSSMIGNKIKSFVQSRANKNNKQARPKSLDFDSIDLLPETDQSHLDRFTSPSMPNSMETTTSSQDSVVGPGTYYYFESNTVPRAHAKKYNFPWESLPKDWTTSVKLREISKRKSTDDRNSSSGAWSASGGSSNRQSLDSAKSSMPLSTSQYSLGKDSGRDSPSLTDDRVESDTAGYAGDQASTLAGDETDSVSDVNANFTKIGTDAWLQRLAIRAASRDDVSSSSAETLHSLSQLTKQNIMTLDMMSPTLKGPQKQDDEVSSVYSLDQEGFYTSFHTDSGLRQSTATLDESDEKIFPVKETQSMLSMCSTNTVESVIFRPSVGDKTDSSDQGTLKRNKIPPAPPKRSCSIDRVAFLQDKEGSSSDSSGTIQESASKIGVEMISDSSLSESDQETIYARLKSKTRITSTMYPSWCSVSSPSTSDEDGTPQSSKEKLYRLDGVSDFDASKTILFLPLDGSTNQKSVVASSVLDDPLMISTSLGVSGKGRVEEDWENDKVPKCIASMKWDEDDCSTNSWPRTSNQPSCGILKIEKSSMGKSDKTLNFAPVVNLFDPVAPKTMELPLPDLSPSEEHGSVQINFANSPDEAYKLAVPLDTPDKEKDIADLPMKYQPVITVKPRPKGPQRGAYVKLFPGSQVDKPSHVVYNTPIIKPQSSTPVKSSIHYAVGQLNGSGGPRVKAPHLSSDLNSPISDGSSSMLSTSSSDCGYMDMQTLKNAKSSDTLSTNSSMCLSDIDSSSLTYVSMSSPISTPSNSMLTLTPESTLDISSENDTYRIPAVTLNEGAKMVAPMTLPSAPVIHRENTSTPKSSPNTFGSFVETDSSCLSPSLHSDKLLHRSSTSPSLNSGRYNKAPSRKNSAPECNTWPSSGASGKQLLSNTSSRSPSQHQLTNPFGCDKSDHCPLSCPLPHCQSVHRSPSGQPHCSHHSHANHSANHVQRSYGLSKQNQSTPSNQSPSQSPNTSRTDSYRYAMKQEFEKGTPMRTMPEPYSRTLTHSKSFPSASSSSSAVVNSPVEVVNRADSYRYAVRNSNGVVGESGRNSSYRVAVTEEVNGSRFDALNRWSGSGKDIRRMGITDINQLKCYSDEDSSKTYKEKSGSTYATINQSKKKMNMKGDIESLLKANKSPSPETSVRKSYRNDKGDIESLLRPSKSPSPDAVVRRPGKSDKDKSKSKTRTSTYIRFDPIFEDKEDFLNSSSETLRASSLRLSAAPSTETLPTGDEGPLLGKHAQAPVRKHSSGKKSVDEKAVMSILDSIKSTIKSISGNN